MGTVISTASEDTFGACCGEREVCCCDMAPVTYEPFLALIRFDTIQSSRQEYEMSGGLNLSSGLMLAASSSKKAVDLARVANESKKRNAPKEPPGWELTEDCATWGKSVQAAAKRSHEAMHAALKVAGHAETISSSFFPLKTRDQGGARS